MKHESFCVIQFKRCFEKINKINYKYRCQIIRINRELIAKKSRWGTVRNMGDKAIL